MCGQPASMKCSMCGRPVCNEHYDKTMNVCASCARGRMAAKIDGGRARR